jgi:S-adenosylmethionine-diacylglycerol 3-amino-3-carboxypropyl transferase
MTDLSVDIGLRRNRRLGEALYQHRPLSKSGLSERLFALLFSGLVYPQIWEDPDVDMEAMRLDGSHRVVTIASGGCNILAYLTRSPASIDAVDLNPHHVALNRLKLTALAHMPGFVDFEKLFGGDGDRRALPLYDRHVAPRLDAATRSYWDKRRWTGRRRIAAFRGNFYQTGLLGACIRAGHLVARLHGVDPAELMEAKTLRDQRHFFEDRLRPLFNRRFIRWAMGRKSSLFGLGIPPQQYDALIGTEGLTMAEIVATRLEKLACDFPLRKNYFAWQAFARRYPKSKEGTRPSYLEAENFETIRAAAPRVTIHHASYIELLRSKPAESVDRFVLLDAQDWMSDRQLNELWTEITRTAAPGARVIFRTADAPSLLPGRVSPAVLGRWHYEQDESARHLANDRSAIYGGFHLYVKRDEP